MKERAIDRLAAKAKKARDNRRPKVWHFIKGNWPKFRRWHDEDAVTFRAMAEMLADEPEVQVDGRGPSEFAVRRAYVSVEALMSKGRGKSRSRSEKPPAPAVLLRPGEVAPGVRPAVPPERSGAPRFPTEQTQTPARSRRRPWLDDDPNKGGS